MTEQIAYLTQEERAASVLAAGAELDSMFYPELTNLSAAFFYSYVPVPTISKDPEFVFIPIKESNPFGNDEDTKCLVAMSTWNVMWEAAQIRPDFFESELPDSLKWLAKYRDQNLYLIPDIKPHRYEAYIPLYHLLSRNLLSRFGLPAFKRPIWPPFPFRNGRELVMPKNFNGLVESAVAQHFWPLLSPGSSISAFDKTEPIRVLAHNLSFWLPHAYAIVEDRLRELERTTPDEDTAISKLERLRRNLPAGVSVEHPRMGGTIWCGEEDAWTATREIVERADSRGNLRGLIDAIRSNRVEEDFSSRWSYAREDFERKLYSKRSKVKVSFVELDDTIPVQGPSSELEDDLVWEDFMTIMDEKERHVVVCLRSGHTNLSTIADELGYATHSPISKKLKRIREKARRYFDL